MCVCVYAKFSELLSFSSLFAACKSIVCTSHPPTDCAIIATRFVRGAASSRFLCTNVFTREMSQTRLLHFVMPRHTLQRLLLPSKGRSSRDNELFFFGRKWPSTSSTTARKMTTSTKLLLTADSNQQQEPFVKQMAGLSEHHRKRRERFLEAEKEWDAKVHWDSLSQEEIAIVKNHKQAVMNGHFTYDDPQLNKKVMTRLRHFLRGSCCGNACRHVNILKLLFSLCISLKKIKLKIFAFFVQCIYNHENVPEELKGSKSFNSAFWVNNGA